MDLSAIRKLSVEITLLAFHKKSLKVKIGYLLKGMLFMPFIVKDTIKSERKGDMSTSMSAAGDDIYPLF